MGNRFNIMGKVIAYIKQMVEIPNIFFDENNQFNGNWIIMKI